MRNVGWPIFSNRKQFALILTHPRHTTGVEAGQASTSGGWPSGQPPYIQDETGFI
jgi:hypothetical protein